MKEILITSSVLIATLLLLRLIFAKKVSRTLIYGAWILVALRLLVPVQIGELDFSVLTAAQPLTETVTEIEGQRIIRQNEREASIQITKDYIERDQTVFTPEVQEYIQSAQEENRPAEEIATAIVKTQGEEVYIPQVRPQVQQQVAEQTDSISIGQLATIIWLAGVAGMALWFLIVNLCHGWLLRRDARKLDCPNPIPVYVSEKVASPCLVGLFHPVVYVTPRCAENPQLLCYVLSHERTHYRHGDHIWSLVRCICLCVYWFNPLVWAAAYISRRDCELACDEGAMKGQTEAERLAYGKTLLEVVSHAASPGKLLLTATSMNETMKQLKERVNFIVTKSKISITAAICMVLICAMIAGCVAAGPTSAQNNPPTTTPSNTTTPTTTQPEQDVTAVKTLASNMYCTTILAKDQSIAGQFEAALDLTVTEHTDSSVSLECALALADDSWYDFTDSGNFFTVQHEELGLPYYCAKAYIYQPNLDGYAPYDFAVDVEKGYLIFKLSANITVSYVVASSDPNVDPMEIVEHFAQFFKIYDYTYMDTGIRTDFYFDLYGAWISENGEILGEMPFYITGKLPEVYEDGDTVEMELNFIWPETFGYRNEGTMTYTGTVNIFENHHGHPNFHGTGTLYDLDTNQQISFAYNIFPLDSTVIIYVNGLYLINDLRSTSQIESRLNYYKEFIFTVPRPTEPTVLLSMIPEETQKRIKEEYLTQFYAQYPEDPGAIDRTSLRVFGVFGDTYALFVDGPFAYLQVITKGTFALTYPSSQNMYVYRDGHFYCNLEAEGLLADEEKRQVVANYYAAYSFLQEEPDDGSANEALAAFNALFGDRQSWYSRALVCQYTDPGQIKLGLLFYLGFEGESREPTVAEWAQLRNQPGFDIHYDLIRLPVDKMNQVLADHFGITLDDVDDSGFENLVYLESTNCYYHMVTDALRLEDFNALSVENKEDGSIRVYYTANWDDTVYVVTLMPYGDGYRILSNMPAE